MILSYCGTLDVMLGVHSDYVKALGLDVFLFLAKFVKKDEQYKVHRVAGQRRKPLIA